MTKWKWLIALRIPAKVFIVNENGDYFWLHRDNAALILDSPSSVRALKEREPSARSAGCCCSPSPSSS